jgi:hypothetical protein
MQRKTKNRRQKEQAENLGLMADDESPTTGD